jgi:hypothetical protein
MASPSALDAAFDDASIRKKQNDYVVEIYSDIKTGSTMYEDAISGYEKTKRAMEHTIDQVATSDSQKSQLKAQSPPFMLISGFIAEIRSNALGLEEFEKKFRAEWKVKKKASLEQRDIFLVAKGRELDKEHERIMARLKQQADEAGQASNGGDSSDPGELEDEDGVDEVEDEDEVGRR